MSFAIWTHKVPFPEEHLNNNLANPDHEDLGEYIYAREAGEWKRVGEVINEDAVDLWCVTDKGLPTPDQVDAVMNPAPQPPARSEIGKLADLLVSKGQLTPAEAATFEQGEVSGAIPAKK